MLILRATSQECVSHSIVSFRIHLLIFFAYSVIQINTLVYIYLFLIRAWDDFRFPTERATMGSGNIEIVSHRHVYPAMGTSGGGCLDLGLALCSLSSPDLIVGMGFSNVSRDKLSDLAIGLCQGSGCDLELHPTEPGGLNLDASGGFFTDEAKAAIGAIELVFALFQFHLVHLC